VAKSSDNRPAFQRNRPTPQTGTLTPESTDNRPVREENPLTIVLWTSEIDRSGGGFRPNTDWANLPLFDRTGWRRLKFGAFADSVDERIEPADAAEEIYVGLEHLDSGSLHIRRWGKGSDVIGTKLRFRKGDVIFGRRRAYQRKLAVAEMEGICSAHAMVVRAKPDMVLPKFLPFLMMSDKFMNRAVEISVGSLSPTINWTTLKLEEFDLPPLDQQRRIAETLRAVDEDAQGYDSLCDALAGARRSLIDGLIPTPAYAVRGQSFTRLDQVASMQNGRPFASAKYQEHGVRLIRPGNLAPDGTLDWSPSATVSLPEDFLEESPGWFIAADQVLINLTAQSLEDGFIGRVCFTGPTDAGLLNQRIGRFVLSGDVLPRFLFRCLQTTTFRVLVENRCEGSKIRHLYFRHFAAFQLPVLSRASQEEIIDKLDAVDACLNASGQAVSRLISLRQALTNTLIE